MKKTFLYMVGRSCSRLLFRLRAFLFLKVDSLLASATEDKVRRMLQPFAHDLEE